MFTTYFLLLNLMIIVCFFVMWSLDPPSGKDVVLLVTFIRCPSGDPYLGFPRFELGVVNFISEKSSRSWVFGYVFDDVSFVPVVFDCFFFLWGVINDGNVAIL